MKSWNLRIKKVENLKNFHVFVFKSGDFFYFRHENLWKKHVAVPQGIVFIIPKHNVKILKIFKNFQKSEKQYLILYI